MEISLKGQVALVTGASRGIGRAISKAYADAGASVLLTSRKLADLEAAAGEIGGDVDVMVANAGDPDQAAAAVDRCIERFGGIDILVNNAATNPYMGSTMDIDLPRYDKTWEVNLRGAARVDAAGLEALAPGARRVGDQHRVGRRACPSNPRSGSTTRRRPPCSTSLAPSPRSWPRTSG